MDVLSGLKVKQTDRGLVKGCTALYPASAVDRGTFLSACVLPRSHKYIANSSKRRRHNVYEQDYTSDNRVPVKSFDTLAPSIISMPSSAFSR